MTSIDTTAQSQTESVSFEFDLPHLPEKVWRALTDPSLLSEWLLPVVGSRSSLVPSSRSELRRNPVGTAACTVESSKAKRTGSSATRGLSVISTQS